MSKHTKENVKRSIQELAMGNYSSYPQDYDPAKQETNINIRSLTKGYWDVRDDKEIQRDNKLGIQLEDYEQWTQEAYNTYVRQHADALT
ncbi:hypothetical protein [Chitinophaga japonensis]|uniref:Uncharacterized protein n=1 Tax=Chitinophaga japonensis TaxID=104662 RepID=A0A562SJM5_CHIJA|nr:hypothetical protein [Chitinophaga japonensis]TWI81036.1 hypothetical protein LX66_5642 [Chitinophaga japonensis]